MCVCGSGVVVEMMMMALRDPLILADLYRDVQGLKE